MDKTTIIDELYRSQKVKALVAKIPAQFADDLKQEMFILLLIKPEVEIIDLHKRGKLFSFFCAMMYNQLTWTNSGFHKLYNTFEKHERRAEPEEVATFEDRYEEEAVDLLPAVESKLKELGAYKESLMRMYAVTKNYRQVAELAGISLGGTYEAIDAIRKEIINKVKK